MAVIERLSVRMSLRITPCPCGLPSNGTGLCTCGVFTKSLCSLLCGTQWDSARSPLPIHLSEYGCPGSRVGMAWADTDNPAYQIDVRDGPCVSAFLSAVPAPHFLLPHPPPHRHPPPPPSPPRSWGCLSCSSSLSPRQGRARPRLSPSPPLVACHLQAPCRHSVRLRRVHVWERVREVAVRGGIGVKRLSE